MNLDIARLVGLVSWRAFDIAPDGRVLAGSDASGTVQLVELGPGSDAAETPLTALPGSVHGRYIPQQRTVVVQHDTDGDERAQLSRLELASDGPPETGKPSSDPGDLTGVQPSPMVTDTRYIHRLLDVLPGRVVYTTNRRDGVQFDVVIRNVVSGGEEVVYNGGGMVLDAAVSPDSRYVAVTVPGNPSLSEQLLLVDTMPTTELDNVTPLTDPDTSAQHTRPAWTKRHELVFTSNAGQDRTGIARLSPKNGKRGQLIPTAAEPDHDLTGWLSPDGALLLVHTNDDGAARLALHDAATGDRVREIDLPGDGWCTFPLPEPVFAPDSRHLALTWSSPTTPGDVLRVDTATGQVDAITDSTAQLGDERLAEPVTYRVPARDGQTIPCLVYAPQRRDTALDGSAVLIVHGGPESQSVRAFNPVAHALAAQGHTVVLPNVRGSTGYGKEWYSADDREQRLEAVADLGDVHDWLPSIGVDPARAALWGGSYGGYMVLAGLAFQPGRWAAGVDIVGISSLVTFLENTAPYRRAHREREYGSLDEDRELLRDLSPLTHVDRITAPLFVLHGANDPRVPLSEARQVATAMREKGLECELLVYDDEGHGLAKRSNRLEAYTRALEFLRRHLAR